MARWLARARWKFSSDFSKRVIAPVFALVWLLVMIHEIYESRCEQSQKATTRVCRKPVEIRDASGVRLGCADVDDAFAPLCLEAYDAVVLARGRPARGISQGMGGGMRLLVGGVLDLNRATVDELTLLARVGRSRAEAIVAYREREGLFVTPSDLVRVPGVGAKLTAQLAAELKAGP